MVYFRLSELSLLITKNLYPLIYIILLPPSPSPSILQPFYSVFTKLAFLFLDSTYKLYHTVFVFLYLAILLSTMPFRFIHAVANGRTYLMFWLNNINIILSQRPSGWSQLGQALMGTGASCCCPSHYCHFPPSSSCGCFLLSF